MDILCSVVVPMYNEEAVARETYRRLTEVMEKTGCAYEIIFVNDGSRDRTAEILNEICDMDKRVKLVNFSRNFGHQIAITAGTDYASGQCVVIIDGDLQDPPELIPEMIEKWKSGYDVVYGKRISRKGETLFKKFTAAAYYRFLRSMTDVSIPVDTGDFRLIDRKVCDALKQVRERNRYVRGLISWLGFRQTAIEFEREERFAGETKYPLKKMVKLALDGITTFSYKPLKLASYIGSIISAVSFIYLIYVVVKRIFFPETVQPGWASILAVSLFFNGITLLMLGIIGEYIGRIYDEVKARPLYVVKNTRNFDNEK
ncbi:glycosyltransferase [Thermoclostridium stercorarium subsp. thermolacticum DSM 2910]|jgi:glycosyltransferase involved in cell wall biosynthesis|uniref:Glycosyltransferase n=2 Tax=Thermoclostridium stercorarium TaxID=1510 RepID=A0A1B1YKI7_THEST|nr:glycosyltransferase family 2 protein [Thermoclostridium stercorarium]ANW98771.1 glycosyltransferase [Thermoclostridium stercorarium subsp. thermolacticum DSM 2910]ANX01288.1 glycosyltransferase [Thermoclostridium stercorarium subsp. leptospartum DSM 9219]UZQ84412.1 glycosyltransferase family 2 protein [Thermoclostridium stercorarium]